jgi:hypothetical protein
MDPELAAVSISAALSVILLIMYWVALGREVGTVPEWAAEVYFVKGAGAAALNAARLRYGARAATQGQIRIYLNAGGQAPSEAGVWLYGPKPGRSASDVTPFSHDYWFQPAQTAAFSRAYIAP